VLEREKMFETIFETIAAWFVVILFGIGLWLITGALWNRKTHSNSSRTNREFPLKRKVGF
jgi:uncharacterized membrane protein